MYKVLVVEDEDIIRKGLVFSIPWEKFDCTVIDSCANGLGGIKAIQSMRPDIVITDINMPMVDGLEMIRQTCEEVEYSAIILSGYSEFEYAQSAIRYGVLGYLLKPLKMAELMEAIERAKRECEKRKRYQVNPQAVASLTQEFAAEIRLDYHGDDFLVKQMLDFIKEHYQQKVLMSNLEKELNYSGTFLNKKFKEAMGTTFMEYMNRYRILQAIEMMTKEKLPVQEVAWKCGIGEYKYFSSVFKKYLGCSPKEYLAGKIS